MEIYVPEDERVAIAAIDTRKLDELLDQAIKNERSENLHTLRLASCGPYIATQFQKFQRALSNYREAKSSRKRLETSNHLEKSKWNLTFAVQAMQRRVEEEKKDEQLFHVQSEFAPPYRFSQQLSAQVRYRWRKTVDDEWVHGRITFIHHADLTPDYSQPRPKRKPSSAKQQQEVQGKLSETWEYLMTGGLYSVRDYFKHGGEAGDIPETFKAKVGPFGLLNNHSTVFWQKKD